MLARKMMLENKVAIVTGASRGMGKAIALLFAREGADLVLNATKRENIEGIAREIEATGRQAIIAEGDVALRETADKIVEAALGAYEKIDILANCAGIITRFRTEELSDEEWHRVINVNLNGTFYLCRAVLPHMKRQNRGKIVNMSSDVAMRAHKGASPSYEVSKAGVLALTRHLGFEYAPYGVCINAICPGPIDTDMPKTWSSEYREIVMKGIPMNRLGQPEEVADCALFLASDMSNYITGESIVINGGRTLA